MNVEERKLRLIEDIIKDCDETTLTKLERVFKWEKRPQAQRKTLFDFAAVLTKNEKAAMWKSVDACEGCGHPDCLYHALH